MLNGSTLETRAQRARNLRLALAQINTTVGDIDGNTEKIRAWLNRARDIGAEIVVFPELAVPGYPPEDLLMKPEFIQANLNALESLLPDTHGLTAIIGFVDAQDDIFNAAAIIHDGQLIGVYHKTYLPNYSVFDEDRYFQAGNTTPVFSGKGVTIGVTICEDIWSPASPAEVQALAGGAELLINISASPYYVGKRVHRERMLATRAADNVAIVAYCNLVGGQDELLFDGSSLVCSAGGEVLARGKAMEEDLVVVDLDIEDVFRRRLKDPRRRKEKLVHQGDQLVSEVRLDGNKADHPQPSTLNPQPSLAEPLSEEAEVYGALVLGTRDYVRKNGFKRVYIGLSGGIDSALTAAIAVDALGAEAVTGVAMPSRYSSSHSIEDAVDLAHNLGIEIRQIYIDDTFQAYLDMLAPAWLGTEPNVAEENLQARIRGNILMALTNKYGGMVLTTGNKSEVSVGYSTLYGDMAGGFTPIKDIYKMTVYALARWRNQQAGRPLIPERSLTKAPSAELRPNQTDQDSLPPYEVLDPILEAYVENDLALDQIVALGYDRATVQRVIRLVNINEYKRRQAPPGIKITARAFGKDRRLPITNAFKGWSNGHREAPAPQTVTAQPSKM
ncbi:MAG: NAD+ synthase [Anaerolineae bacterium]|nr:NAD+ synthase [Anaerolineae bacterium]